MNPQRYVVEKKESEQDLHASEIAKDSSPKNSNENNEKTEKETLSSTERDALILEHASMIRYIAQRIAARLPGHVELSELESSGILGLIDAVEKFDPSKGFKFKTYAEARIRGSILDNLRSIDWVPRSIRHKIRQLEEIYANLEQKLGRSVKDHEVAEVMQLPIEEVQSLQTYASAMAVLGLDESIEGIKGGYSRKLSEVIADPKSNQPLMIYEKREVKEVISDAIKRLPEKESIVISAYYKDGLTMREIGESLGLTESRVCQIHSRALLRLKSQLRKYFNHD